MKGVDLTLVDEGGRIALEQANRLISSRGTEAVYREELGQVLAELTAASDAQEFANRVAKLVHALAVIADAAICETVRQFEEHGVDLDRQDFLLIIERAIANVSRPEDGLLEGEAR